MFENNITTITKKCSMTIGSKSWREGIESKTTNIYSGFRSAGLWTLSFPDVQRRLKLFKYVVISFSEENPNWMMCRETARTEILSPPPAIDIILQRRRSIDVNNWVFQENV